MGTRLGDHQTDCLSYIRFGDDVLLFSTTLEQLKIMMRDFTRTTEKVGLNIHPDRTKILSNQVSNDRTEVTTSKWRYYQRESAQSISEKQKRPISKKQQKKCRIRAAWASFTEY